MNNVSVVYSMIIRDSTTILSTEKRETNMIKNLSFELSLFSL